MVAKKTMIQTQSAYLRSLQNKKGQSILEVILLLPFLFAFVAFLYKMDMAAQMSINNVQFVRSQTYVLTANSPEYPRVDFRFSPGGFVALKQDRMILGVADPTALQSANRDQTKLDPIPQIQKVTRAGVNGSNALGEVTNRTDIRIRSTAAICTQLNSADGNAASMLPENVPMAIPQPQRWPFGQEVCRYQGLSGS
jgi:hypothetical protein